MRQLACLLALLVCAAPAGAEIYRWTDASGRVHFTQDLNQVPPAQRKSAEGAAAQKQATPDAGSVQRFSNSGGHRAPPARQAPSARGSKPGDVHRIRVSKAGTSMIVQVRLNGSVTAPFLLDTGASDVLLPQAVAQKLGLDTGPGARTKRYSTANGVVEHPVVMLRSVDLGGAKVENVPASVSESMSIGLLGLSFFNHFTYNVDAAAGVLTLQRNGLVNSGQIRGGRSAVQWRSEYANLGRRIEWVKAEHDEKTEAKSRTRRRLQQELARLEEQLEQLDEEADQARVPMAWRR